MKVRLVHLLALATAAAALIVAGCGGDDSSGSDPAAVAPADSPVFIDVAVRPEGDLQTNLETLAKSLAGIDDLGGFVIEQLEESAAGDGEEFDYEKEVEPWLGEKAGISLQEYDGEDFQGFVVAVATTDTGAAQEFVDDKADEVAEEPSYEGTDFKVEEDGEAVGIVGDFLVFAENEASFKAAVDASNEESLADQDAYTSAVDAAPAESLANVFVDVGGLIEESGGAIDPETEGFLETAGIEPKDATALASVVPGSNQIEIDFATDLVGDDAPTGDASQLLGSLPGGSFAAFATTEFGKRLSEAIDQLDENGIPGELEPNELKSAMKAANIDLDRIGGSIEDLGVFAQGNTESNLTGAVVLTTTDAKEAKNTVSNIGLLLRASETPGITAISENGVSGFSISDDDLGAQPLVVAAKGEKIAISYGPVAAAAALTAGKSATLAENPAFKAAGDALGDTPLSGFIAGPATVALVENMLSPEEAAELAEVRPLLDKIEYVAIGTGSDGDLATSKLILGFDE
ncbi:MAG: hypothetical protein QOE75_772 [Solirubrobacterales bacterium]|jgi:hypothetical protein|nr:hypothetical protein [Solirubrobacterales bacterium]